MNIKSIESVNKNKQNNNQEYNFYIEVIDNNIAYNIYEFTCTDRHEMRLDLVCFDIYENQDYLDILTNLNNMRNLFDVKKGDIIYFIDVNDIQNTTTNVSTINNIKDQIKNNKGKSFKRDNNRQKDIANRKQTETNKNFIPPNILDTNQSNTTIANGKITLSPNF